MPLPKPTLLLPLLAILSLTLHAHPPTTYYPPKDAWQTRTPADVGMDEAKLNAAVDWAKAHETNRPKDLSDQPGTRIIQQ